MFTPCGLSTRKLIHTFLSHFSLIQAWTLTRGTREMETTASSHLATPIDTESNLPNRTQQVLFNHRFVEIYQCMCSDKS